MVEHLTQGNQRLVVPISQPDLVELLSQRAVERKLTFLNEMQSPQRRNRLAKRSRFKKRVRGNRFIPGIVCRTKTTLINNPALFHDRNRKPRNVFFRNSPGNIDRECTRHIRIRPRNHAAFITLPISGQRKKAHHHDELRDK